MIKLSPSENLTRWIVNLIYTSQVQAIYSVIGNSASAMDAQKVFKTAFENLISAEYSNAADGSRYQNVLQHAQSKAESSVGENIYMISSDLNLQILKK